MDLWTQEDVDLVAPGFIDFGADHMGSLGFIAVQGGLDWRDAIGGRRFSRYVEAAAQLGSDHWMPIEAMAESALRSGRQELAVEVFRAADRPGFHQRHLRQRCLALTGVDIDDEGHDPRPTLRVVGSPGGHP